ncbi:AEC family transporter [Vreelandella venusta]|uniref:Transporter n=1 Tax=Vreelandella venusta TaxID=44935 RepID=A0AAQ0CGL5_9GAMM|nr:AEC family transporter [Halomonas venusta]MBR9926739.1 AEC family transporter [Gammaproteobacteria bacterium]AZM97203.1 AEC family transporter [Halomonas venusta]MDW0361294.1 AEC family transporter [Halomonas venusta]MDX1714179.1 AEC family transporter [Halomonas venusta]NPT32509.1 transporter [Halomonas venusta]
MIGHILATLLPVFLIAGCGAVYGRYRNPDIRSLNTLNMELFVPLLVFAVLADRQAPLADYAWLATAAVAVVLGSGVVLWPIAKWLSLDTKVFLPPMMFNNSGNMGVPLLVLAFGPEALPAAVVVFIVEMLLHFSVGLYMLDPRTSLWRLLRMPIVAASLAGLVINVGDVPLPSWLLEAMHMLGGICIPLMLFALGVRLLEIDFNDWRTGLLGALLCPLSGLVIALPLMWLLPLNPLQTAVLLVFAALPPAVLNYLVAEQYKLAPQKVASLVLIGNLGSLIVMPLTLAAAFAWIQAPL